jgi:hypothetical protein
MHHRLLAAAGLAAALCLCGCDNPQPAATAAQPCNCQPAPSPVAQSQQPDEHLARRFHASHSYSAGEVQEQQSYSYQSGSRSYEESEERATEQSASSQASSWVDGYGRSHYVVAANDQAQSGAPTVSVPPDTKERRDPWRAYDSKCDEKK